MLGVHRVELEGQRGREGRSGKEETEMTNFS